MIRFHGGIRSAVVGLILLLPVAACADAWFLLPNSPAHPARHEDVTFAGESTGWVVTRDGRVSKTTDGGAFWSQTATLDAFLRSVAFADTLHGWAGSLTPDSTLFATSDGGTTWDLIDLPEPKPNGLCGLWAVNASVVYGCGAFYGVPRVVKTTDGGATWSTIDMTPYASTLIDCYFTSADSGFVVGGLGAYPDSTRALVLFTSDGGATWSSRFATNRKPEWCWKISFPSPLVGYISLERTVLPVSFLKTTDGGATWTRKPFPPSSREQGIGFVTETVGWIGGEAVTYGSTDGGDTWQADDWGDAVNRIRVVGNGRAYAVGTRVYKLDAANPTAVAAGAELGETASVPIPPLLFQNKPNPFRSGTTIDFVLETAAIARLSVFDLSGAKVVTLAESQMSKGLHRALWDGKDDSGRDVAAGVYVYRLDAGGQVDARRMFLVR